MELSVLFTGAGNESEVADDSSWVVLEMLITALLRLSTVCSLLIKQDHQKTTSVSHTVTVSTDSRVSVVRDKALLYFWMSRQFISVCLCRVMDVCAAAQVGARLLTFMRDKSVTSDWLPLSHFSPKPSIQLLRNTRWYSRGVSPVLKPLASADMSAVKHPHWVMMAALKTLNMQPTNWFCTSLRFGFSRRRWSCRLEYMCSYNLFCNMRKLPPRLEVELVNWRGHLFKSSRTVFNSKLLKDQI